MIDFQRSTTLQHDGIIRLVMARVSSPPGRGEGFEDISLAFRGVSPSKRMKPPSLAGVGRGTAAAALIPSSKRIEPPFMIGDLLQIYDTSLQT